MAFCGKCGTKNDDSAMYCAKCGAKLKNNSDTANIRPVSEIQTSVKNKKIGMAAVGAAAIVVVVLAVFLFGGRSYKAVIKQYVDNTFNADAKAIVELIPDDVMEYMMEEEGYDRDDLDDQIDEMEEYFENTIETLDDSLGKNWKMSYEILAVEDMKGDDLDDIKDSYEDADIKVSAAKKVEVEIMITADETENSNTLDVSLIKVGRSWYLDTLSMGSFF